MKAELIKHSCHWFSAALSGMLCDRKGKIDLLKPIETFLSKHWDETKMNVWPALGYRHTDKKHLRENPVLGEKCLLEQLLTCA